MTDSTGFCSACGATRVPAGAFCGTCGARYGELVEPPAQLDARPQAGTHGRGVGWWVRTAIITVIALGAIGYLSRQPPTPPAAADSAAGQASRTARTVTGSGIAKSEPFALAGDYSVKWTATPDSDTGCYHGANLERADGELFFEPLVNELLDSRSPKSGSTRLYGMVATRYYVEVSSGCAWSFTFTPE